MLTNRPGRQNPFTLMLEQAFESLMRQAMFCLPGRVVGFDPDTQLAQVECGIQRIVDGQPETIPVIENVPVCFPGDGEFYFWHQITPGETEGVVQFSQRAMDTWLDQGGPVAPHERRMLSESDAIFVPGVRSKPGAIPNFNNDGAGFGNYAGDTFVHLKSSGDIEIGSSGNADVTVGGNVDVEAGGSVTATAAAITINGPTTINGTLLVNGAISGAGGSGASIAGSISVTSGDVTADGISLKNHTHGGVEPGGGNTGPAQ